MDTQHEQADHGPAGGTPAAEDGVTPASLPVIAVAASAGGLPALSYLLGQMPMDLPAATLVLQHLDPQHASQLAALLARRSPLGVVQAEAGQRLEPGVVAVAPPAHHLTVTHDGTLALSDEDAVRFVRPSADVLFASLAQYVGQRAIVVVLTGTGEDGSGSLCEVREHGGTIVVQDPGSAEFPGMPRAAVATGCTHHVISLDEIPELLQRLVREVGL